MAIPAVFFGSIQALKVLKGEVSPSRTRESKLQPAPFNNLYHALIQGGNAGRIHPWSEGIDSVVPVKGPGLSPLDWFPIDIS